MTQLDRTDFAVAREALVNHVIHRIALGGEMLWLYAAIIVTLIGWALR